MTTPAPGVVPAGPRPEPACTQESRVASTLAGTHRPGVALSGGVDSSLLPALAVRTLGAENVVAILGVCADLAADERSAAHDSPGAGAGVEIDDPPRPGPQPVRDDGAAHEEDSVARFVGGPVVEVPTVVAVTTSVGQGAAFDGPAPLLTMLNVGAPGVGGVDIDNGYGAGHLATRMAAPCP